MLYERGERPSNGVVKEIGARNPIFGAAIMQRGRGRQKGSMVQGVTCLTRCDSLKLAKQKLLNVKIITFVHMTHFRIAKGVIMSMGPCIPVPCVVISAFSCGNSCEYDELRMWVVLALPLKQSVTDRRGVF